MPGRVTGLARPSDPEGEEIANADASLLSPRAIRVRGLRRSD